MAQLPRGGNFDRRLTVAPRGITKINAMQDERELILNQQRIRTRPNDVLFTGGALRGEYSNEASKVYDYEPAVVVKAHATRGSSRGLTSVGNRNANNNDYRVPIVSVVNGAVGKTAFDIQQRYTVLGVTEQTGRYSGSEGLNVILAGMITITNSSDETIHAGDYVGAFVPTVEEAERIHAISGNAANTLGKGGRIPFIYKTIDPGTINYHHHNVILEVAKSIYNPILNSPYSFIRPAAGPNKKAGIDALEHSLHVTIDLLVMAVARIIAFGDPAAASFNVANTDGEPSDQSITSAINLLITSGFEESFRGFTKGTPNATPVSNANQLNMKKGVLKSDPIGAMLHALDAFRFNVADVMVGRAVHTLLPRHDGDIVLGKLNN